MCQTQTQRIVVDTQVGGVLRYRAWNKPRHVTDMPDLEIAKGELTIEGTQVCAFHVYTFKKGTAEYRVDGGLGCWGYAESSPEEATGRLEAIGVGLQATNSWCY